MKTIWGRVDALNPEQYYKSMVFNQLVNYSTETDPLSLIFDALADPTRRSILVHLANGPATVNELAEPFPISLPAISRHLKVLEQAGLIRRTKKAQYRPCQLNISRLQEPEEWLGQLLSARSHG